MTKYYIAYDEDEKNFSLFIYSKSDHQFIFCGFYSTLDDAEKAFVNISLIGF